MISIIIPAFNAEKYIERCLNSVLNSSYKNFEVIVIDDGSNDKTASIVKVCASKDKRIKMVVKENGGSASARNLGLKIAAGDYIAFVDADDYISSKYLEILHNTIIKYDVDIVECDFLKVDSYCSELVDDNQTENQVRIISNIEKLEQLCKKNTYLKSAVLWNKLYKKDIFKNILFIEGKGIDDEYVVHEIFFEAKKVAIVNNKLYFYFMSENSQMRSSPSLKILDSIEAIEGQMSFFEKKDLIYLKEMLYYRYYSSLINDIYFLKKYFPFEKDKISTLKKKNKKVYRAFISKYVPFRDKCYLLTFLVMPSISKAIHDKIKKN